MLAACSKCLKGSRPADETGAAKSRQAGHPPTGIVEEPRLRQAAEEEPVVDRMLTIARRNSKGCSANARPCRRHCHRRQAARSACARSTAIRIKTCRHPVQHEMGGTGGAGEIRFSGSEDMTVLKTAVSMSSSAASRSICRTFRWMIRNYEIWARRTKTVGIFQVESAGFAARAGRNARSRLEDIIALVALYRPGPMAKYSSYCARKAGD